MLTPIEDRIIVLPEEPESVTESGIHLPENIERDSLGSRWGKVLAAGPGKYDNRGQRIDHGILDGDRVCFGEYAGAAIRDRETSQELFILRAEECLAVER